MLSRAHPFGGDASPVAKMKFSTRFAARLAMAAALSAPVPATLSAPLLHHVHGLAFSADGSSLYIPSHFGLAIWRDGRWSKGPGPAHDYMGFSATRRHLYSSGHPAHGAGLVNPFGLLKSGDGGKTWRKLGLEGEADFHVMAAGYDNPAVYVYNTEPNSRMRRAGIHVTFDDGRNWSPPHRRRDCRGRSWRLQCIPQTRSGWRLRPNAACSFPMTQVGASADWPAVRRWAWPSTSMGATSGGRVIRTAHALSVRT